MSQLPSLRSARSEWNIGSRMLDEGKWKEAKAVFNGLLRSTDAKRVVLACARCDLGLGLVDSATRLCRNLNKREPSPESLTVSGVAELLKGEFSNAMEFFKASSR